MICRRSRPVLVLHERKTRITLMSRLAGKTAAETIAAMMAAFRRLDPRMRGSVTFDNDTCFARHMLLRGMLARHHLFLRRLRQLAEGRGRERQRPDPTMAAARHRSRRDQRSTTSRRSP